MPRPSRPTRPTRLARLALVLALTVVNGLAGLAGSAWAQADLLPSIPLGSIAVNLDPIATGLGAPDYAISAPGNDRLFVVEQIGTLRVIENGVLLPTPALDISARIGLGAVAGPTVSFNPANANDERGFLGLAFHPGFADPQSAGFRTLYTYSSESLATGAPTFAAPNGAVQNFRMVVNEYKMSAGNPALVDASTRREIVSFGKNANNQNGGTIAFGQDGYLYLGLGDGGNANDVGPSHLEPGGNSQNLSTPLGKMLRIDPLNPALTVATGNPLSTNGQYRIPADNPFVGLTPVAEIYALGLRNPYRFSVDRANGQIILADVGQNNIEEIDRLQAGGNYGWAVKEGTFLFNRTDPDGAGPITAGSVGAQQPGQPGRADRPHQRSRGHAPIRPPGRHLRHRRLRLPRRSHPRADRQVRVRRPGAIQCTAAGRRSSVLREPAVGRDQGIPAAAIRERQAAERADGARLWRRRVGRALRPGDQHAGQRYGRAGLQVRVRTGARHGRQPGRRPGPDGRAGAAAVFGLTNTGWEM